jgi:tetraacyldisaccharide 4'-kinase
MRTAGRRMVRRWWAGELGAAGVLMGLALAPAEAVFRLVIAARSRAYEAGLLRTLRATVPVISIGNLTVGGTGKTPFTRWLAERLHAHGQSPAIVHGGYADDEPDLYRTWTPAIPVFVARDRGTAAGQAAAAGASVILLDDAFQHRRLHRNLDVVLIAAERFNRTTRVLPCGPWREPRSALARADLLVVTRKTASPTEAAHVAADVVGLSRRPVVRAHLHSVGWRRTAPGRGPGTAVPSHKTGSSPVGPVIAVSGVAEPDLFVQGARAAGADVVGEVTFPDHHEYTTADAGRIRRLAAGRPVVTTEKDWTKLAHRLTDCEVWLLVQEVVIEAGLDTIDACVARMLP